MQRKTPPKATSSPNTHALNRVYVESFDKVMSIALFIDANIVRFDVVRALLTSGDVLNRRDEK